MTDEFFKEQSANSAVKTKIVLKYFDIWSKIMKSKSKGNLGYIDFFAGPGRFEDGTPSTPVLILTHVLNDEELRRRVVMLLNEADEASAESLRSALSELSAYDELNHPPQISVGDGAGEFAESVAKVNKVPCFMFVDPWGYKGLSSEFLKACTRDWGCDCLFFFNYTRINMGVRNPMVEEHMNALIGADERAHLAAAFETATPKERETLLVEAICEQLGHKGSVYVLPFRFRGQQGRTSHFLFFVSKHPLGYELMKDVMASEATGRQEGVASFEYHESTANQGLLFQLSMSPDDLDEVLLKDFAGKTTLVNALFREHNIDRPFVLRDYKQAILRLEKRGVVHVTPEKRRPGTLNEKTCMVRFPSL